MKSGFERPRGKSIELADGVMLAVVVIWSVNNVLTKAALDRGLEPLIYILLRFTIVVVLFFAWLSLRGVPLGIRREDIPRFLVSGVAGFTIFNLLFVVGLSHTSTFSAAILISLGPIFILLISAALGLETIRPLQWGGVALSILGVSIFIGDKLLSGEPATGDVLNVIAALSFAIYALTSRKLVLRYGASLTTAWSALIGLVAVLPFTLGAARDEVWSSIGSFGWFAIFYAGVGSVMIGYALWGWAIARTGAGRSVPYLFLIPVLTGVLAVVFRGDRLGAAQVVGGAVALAGIAVARVFARPEDRLEVVLPAEQTSTAPQVESSPRAVPGP